MNLCGKLLQSNVALVINHIVNVSFQLTKINRQIWSLYDVTFSTGGFNWEIKPIYIHEVELDWVILNFNFNSTKRLCCNNIFSVLN